MPGTVQFDSEELSDLCRRWQVAELSLFGSALSGRLTPQSDVDLLVTFLPSAKWSLLDHAAMQSELEVLFRRPVDLVSRRGVERSRNPIRRKAILSSSRPIYAAR